MQATVRNFDPEQGDGDALLDDGTLVTFAPEIFDESNLRLVRPGQRVSIYLDGDGRTVTRLWIQGIGPEAPIT